MTTTGAGRAKEADVRDVRALLARGMAPEALATTRAWRRSRGAEGALLHADALLQGARPADAAATVARGLRGAVEGDLSARLRLARAEALLRAGRTRAARREAARAARTCSAPATRARLMETMAALARRDQELVRASRRLQAAAGTYEELALWGRAAQARAGLAAVLADRGDPRGAQAALAAADRLAARSGRGDVRACVLVSAAHLAGTEGDWAGARAAADAAAEIFAAAGDPREWTLAGLTRVAADLAAGDLGRVRRTIERVGELAAGETLVEIDRRLAEVDLRMVSGDQTGAAELAAEVADLARSAADRAGECRARTRRAHLLASLGRNDEAFAEARRAEARAGTRLDLMASAAIARGRTRVSVDPGAAGEAFDVALGLAGERRGIAALARLGRAVLAADAAAVGQAVERLESWGDRRLLCLALGELGVRGGAGGGGSTGAAQTAADRPGSAGPGPVVEAAVALLGDGPWASRCAAALHAVRRVVRWWRAVVVASPGCEFRGGHEGPQPLPADDLARAVAAEVEGPAQVDLTAARWQHHPVRVLHGVATALLVPLWAGAVLYVDAREKDAFGDGALAVLCDVGRLLAADPGEVGGPEPEAIPGLVGGCPAMRELIQAMQRVAGSDLAVHLTGETGTGKELVARALHDASRRRGAFVPVNASSCADELFESEMFGHVRGAFTGAAQDRDGHVAAAEGGTLFLDEVADLTPRAQARLLRFLQDRHYRRVGETRLRRADVRIVSAANQPLATRLRDDLVYRLDEFTLRLPPLRERGADLALLTAHFLREGGGRARLSAQARRALAGYPWPGNVRELRSVLRAARVRAGRAAITPDHLGETFHTPRRPGPGTLRAALSAFERDHVKDALLRHGGHRVRTAAALGITRQALSNKIHRLGI